LRHYSTERKKALMKNAVKQAWVAWLLVPVLFSCATYSNKMAGYYQSINRADYKRADEILSGNSFLQHERNKLLFFMEKGKIYHLMGAYDSSNLYFNLADNFIENSKKTAGDAIAGNLLNPMMKTYQGEDYERFLIHYYKALNYFYIGETDEAVVEARRISLSTSAQQQKFSPTSNKYTEDAFALIVQGLIYEAAAQTNNAFISYRNAANLFLNTAGGGYYGVAMPQQLKQDLLKTADQMGFGDQVSFYQQKFNTTHTPLQNSEGGELIVFFERGTAPVKTEQNFVLTRDGSGGGGFLFTSEYGTMSVPFDYSYGNVSRDASINKFRTIRVAVPAYVTQPYGITGASVTINGQSKTAELVEDINTLAPAILRERILKEVSSALVRQVVKKLTEAGVSAVAKEVSKSNNKEKDENKKEAKAETAALTAGLLVNLFNTATEKADTRNWQSLPAFIQYARVPLLAGENNISLQAGGVSKTIRVIGGNGKIQFYNWVVAQ